MDDQSHCDLNKLESNGYRVVFRRRAFLKFDLVTVKTYVQFKKRNLVMVYVFVDESREPCLFSVILYPFYKTRIS